MERMNDMDLCWMNISEQNSRIVLVEVDCERWECED